MATVLQYIRMELEEFLKLVFNKESPDSYSDIRQSITQSLSLHDANSLYHAFRFKPSISETVRCIGYSYFDHGILISYNIMGSLKYPVQYYIKEPEDLIYTINTNTSKWMNRSGMLNARHRPHTICSSLCISSQNIEFYCSISINALKYGSLSPFNISISMKRIRKSDNKIIFIKYDVKSNYLNTISNEINRFCYIVSLPLEYERQHFNNNIIS